jgi:hypothetical protein
MYVFLPLLFSFSFLFFSFRSFPKKKKKNQNRKGEECIHYAAQSGNVDCVKMLIELGADRHAVDSKHVTPLFAAKKHKFNDVVALLEGSFFLLSFSSHFCLLSSTHSPLFHLRQMLNFLLFTRLSETTN